MFLQLNLSELNNYTIHLEWRLLLDHAPLTIDIVIIKEQIQTKKCTIVKNNKKEKNFIAEIIKAIKELNMAYITSKEVLEQIIQEFADTMNRIWFKNSKIVKIRKHSKSCWNKEC